jgi:hypothetical protein
VVTIGPVDRRSKQIGHVSITSSSALLLLLLLADFDLLLLADLDLLLLADLDLLLLADLDLALVGLEKIPASLVERAESDELLPPRRALRVNRLLEWNCLAIYIYY